MRRALTSRPSMTALPRPIRMAAAPRSLRSLHMIRLILSAALSILLTASAFAANHPLTPRIVGQWWTIAADPDLGELTTPKQQPVDFGIWPASDGTWQLWSCIRG